ncbi:efflux RND transporter periplasmic adaptor subunit [Asticcacaulis sp.]|uniref:efflux RND transporter periplasmic adaptor subunit n=1 Tax=Asticcacaulis sp. TaxID=1872648 RepID=UPI002B5AF460|nr:efflux RND transporter periplasmic adaptor subunit [Asticcacaulis sp.]HTM82063.1 efflux RND transporter periplasmic adaptor subunit [Asticcacaulis sp.]
MKLPKPNLSHLLWLGAGIVLLAAFLWMMWPRSKAVETAIVDRGVVQHDIIDEGRTRIHNVFVVAAPVAGELQRIAVEPGDAVVRGQTVALLSPASPALLDARLSAETQAGIMAAAAGLRSADADLALARRDRLRTQTLFDRGYASQAALDNATAVLDAAQATRLARLAQLKQAQVAAGTPGGETGVITTVKSPVAGQVLQLYQQSETVLPAGSPLLSIGDPAEVEIVSEFLSQDAVLMKVGNNAFVEGWGGNTPIPARISRIEPYAHTKVSALGVEEQRVNVIAQLIHPDSAPSLGHGFRVDLRVVISRQEGAMRVPVDCLVRNGEAWSVFRVEKGRAVLRPVQIGDGGDRFRAVISGLSAGDRLVLFPGDTLRSGDKVQPK